ncbi:hypothetical protein NUSPORA_00587 [Nucleospora cyclopteri]
MKQRHRIILNILDFLIDSKLVYFIHRIISYVILKIQNYTLEIKNDHNEKYKLLNELKKHHKTFLKERKHSKMMKGLNLAFICDGNRRWAKKQGISVINKKIERGLEKITEIIRFCYCRGIESISFYVFALRNFKRDTNEIDGIKKFIINNDFKEIPVRIKIYGDFEAFQDPKIKEKLIELDKKTSERKFNDFFTLNFFLGYNSTECDKNVGNPNMWFDERVDILIRTSGEKRLSDFLVRNVASGTSVQFVTALWPEFTISQLYLIVYKYKLEEKFLIKK